MCPVNSTTVDREIARDPTVDRFAHVAYGRFGGREFGCKAGAAIRVRAGATGVDFESGHPADSLLHDASSDHSNASLGTSASADDALVVWNFGDVLIELYRSDNRVGQRWHGEGPQCPLPRPSSPAKMRRPSQIKQWLLHIIVPFLF
jgi:hypothetical protein